MAVDRMKRFEIFIGTWNTRGEVLATRFGPGGTLNATDVYRWLPGRKFIIHEVDARFGDEPTRSIEVIGFDAARKTHLARSFSDQGEFETFEVELSGRRWRIAGKKVRFDGRFSRDGDTLTGLWELKTRRVWEPWIDLTLERA